MIKLAITLDSHTLHRPVPVAMAIPHHLVATGGPYSVVWALHCAMSGGDFFGDIVDIGSYIDSNDLVFIAPSLGNGYFVDSAFENQASFLQDEFLPAMQLLFPLSQQRENNYLLGISMGGFGALRWALQCPGIFSRVAAISGVFDQTLPLDPRAKKDKAIRALVSLFGDNFFAALFPKANSTRWAQANLAETVEHFSRSAYVNSPPEFALYCGEGDYLSLPQTQHASGMLQEAGIPAACFFSSGSHNRDYWRHSVPEAMNWLLQPTQTLFPGV